jgi:hypothetical protein
MVIESQALVVTVIDFEVLIIRFKVMILSHPVGLSVLSV